MIHRRASSIAGPFFIIVNPDLRRIYGVTSRAAAMIVLFVMSHNTVLTLASCGQIKEILHPRTLFELPIPLDLLIKLLLRIGHM